MADVVCSGFAIIGAVSGQSVSHPKLDTLREEVNGGFREILQQNERPKWERNAVGIIEAGSVTVSESCRS